MPHLSHSSIVDTIQRQPIAPHIISIISPPSTVNALIELGRGNDSKNIMDITTAVQSVRPSDVASGLYTTQFKGKVITLTPVQRDQLNAAAKTAIKKSLGRARRDADYAKSGYEIQKKINEEHWFVSAFVVEFAGVRSKSLQLEANVLKAKASAAAAENALQANNFVEAGRRLAECEMAAKQARTLWHEYHEGIIGTGEKTVTVLEYTRDASFATLGVLAIIATGGAAAAGTGAVSTTTAFGFEVGTVSTVNVIATGAPIAATLGSVGVQVALGDKVDWTKIGIDIAVNLILSRFGGKVSNSIFTRMMGNSSVRSIGAIAFGRIFSGLITHELSTAFTASVDATYRKLKGQNVTWDQFSDELVEHLLDPKGLVVAGIMGAVVATADVKLGGARDVEKAPSKDGRPGSIKSSKELPAIETQPATKAPFRPTRAPPKAVSPKTQLNNATTTHINELKKQGFLQDRTSSDGRLSIFRHPDTGERVEIQLRQGGPSWLRPIWGRSRIESEIRDRGFMLSKPTKGEGGLIYRNNATGEEIRIMPKPDVINWDEPIEKHLNDFYYRYRSRSDKEWGPHTIWIRNKSEYRRPPTQKKLSDN